MPNLRAYESSVSRLLVLLAIGLAVVWPLFRLSAHNRGAPRIIAFVDFVAMAFTLQVVLWPMRISGQWSFTRLIALDWMLCAWSLIIAACIAMGTVGSVRRSSSSTKYELRNTTVTPAVRFLHVNARRGLWMFIALLLSIVGPLLAIVLNPESSAAQEIFQWSPIAAAWWMSTHTLDQPEVSEWMRLSIITMVGLIAWFGLLLQAKSQEC